GQQVATAGGFSIAAQFSKGVVKVYDLGVGTGFSSSQPSTWTPGTPLATYSLTFDVGPNKGVHQTVLPGPLTGPFAGAQITQPGSLQDLGSANLNSPFNDV